MHTFKLLGQPYLCFLRLEENLFSFSRVFYGKMFESSINSKNFFIKSMRRKTLLLLAVIGALVGLCCLALAGVWLESHPDQTSLLTLTGKVTSVSAKGKTTFIKLIPGELQVVSFNELDIREGANVTLVGRLHEYKGRVEFVAERVQNVKD